MESVKLSVLLLIAAFVVIGYYISPNKRAYVAGALTGAVFVLVAIASTF